jgi:hypothetical protein
LTAEALTRDESVSERLRTLSLPAAREAAREFDAGALATGLRHLGLDPRLGRLVARWPKTLGPALRRFDQLPPLNQFRVHLAETVGYLGLVLLVQLIVKAALSAKVLPVFEKMGGGGVLFVDLSQVVSTLLMWLLLPLGLWVFLGASGSPRLPGWGRQFERARAAAAVSALVEAGAPDDVRAEALREFVPLGSPPASAPELEELFLDASADTERALNRFLLQVRVVGFTLVTVQALVIVLSVYGFVARLPGAS